MKKIGKLCRVFSSTTTWGIMGQVKTLYTKVKKKIGNTSFEPVGLVKISHKGK